MTPVEAAAESTSRNASESLEIEMTLNEQKESPSNKIKRVKYTKEDRIIREEMHKLHLLCLLASAILRNRLCSSEELAVDYLIIFEIVLNRS